MTPVQYLIQADELLHKIDVQGDSVFRLADARRLLKLAYDEVRKREQEVNDDGGQENR